MKNNYGLNSRELDILRKRDKYCVYCKKPMFKARSNEPRKDWATIEHLNCLPPWNNIKTVVFCCWSCNSSRGNKKILDWFDSGYCKINNIKYNTVAKPVKEYIANFEK